MISPFFGFGLETRYFPTTMLHRPSPNLFTYIRLMTTRTNHVVRSARLRKFRQHHQLGRSTHTPQRHDISRACGGCVKGRPQNRSAGLRAYRRQHVWILTPQNATKIQLSDVDAEATLWGKSTAVSML